MPANPLAPQGPRRRHPKMLPDGAREKLLETVSSARDRLVVTWLADGGLGLVSCAGCTWSTCTCGRMRPAGSAAPRTCTCATDPTTPTMPRPRPNTRGGLKTDRDRRVGQAGQPGDDPHLLRLHHHRIPAWLNGSRDAAGAAARRRRGAAVGAGRGPRHAGSCGQARRSGSGDHTRFGIALPRRCWMLPGQPVDRPGRGRLGLGRDGRRNLWSRRCARSGLRHGVAHRLG